MVELDALTDVPFDVFEVFAVGVSAATLVASGFVDVDCDGAGSRLVVVGKNVFDARKDDMAAGVLVKLAGNPATDDSGLLNAIASLFRPSRPLSTWPYHFQHERFRTPTSRSQHCPQCSWEGCDNYVGGVGQYTQCYRPLKELYMGRLGRKRCRERLKARERGVAGGRMEVVVEKQVTW